MLWLYYCVYHRCKAQGFMVQLTVVSGPVYSGLLTLYYLLTIRYGWKEDRTKKVEPYMHALAILLGLSTAIVGLVLDLYHNAGLWCWIAPPGEICPITRLVIVQITIISIYLASNTHVHLFFHCCANYRREL